jgi:hypothetical protein
MAAAKAIAVGEVLPVLPKYPPSFGAPFVANWNDYTSVEEGVNAVWALLAAAFGILAGTNLRYSPLTFSRRSVFTSRVGSCATIRCFPSRRRCCLRSTPTPLAWPCSPWLGLLLARAARDVVVWWCLAKHRSRAAAVNWGSASRSPSRSGSERLLHGPVSSVLALAALAQAARRSGWRKVLSPILIGTAATATFLLMNVDTFTSATSGGTGAAVSGLIITWRCMP